MNGCWIGFGDKTFCIVYLLILVWIFVFMFSSGCFYQVCISSTCIIGSGSPSGQKTLFTLAAATSSNSSRTSKWVWDNGVIISLGVLRKSRSSHIWRLCRVLEGLSLDYG